MWLRLNLEGMDFQLQINGYEPSQRERWDDQWCGVDYSFKFRDTISYSRNNDCILLSCEVEDLQTNLEDLLADKIIENKYIECIEPDFEFILEPKYDIRNSKDIVYVAPGHEIIDVTMQLRVNLWAENGLSANYFSTTFGREEIEIFNIYLKLISERITRECDEVQNLENKGIIIYTG